MLFSSQFHQSSKRRRRRSSSFKQRTRTRIISSPCWWRLLQQLAITCLLFLSSTHHTTTVQASDDLPTVCGCSPVLQVFQFDFSAGTSSCDNPSFQDTSNLVDFSCSTQGLRDTSITNLLPVNFTQIQIIEFDQIGNVLIEVTGTPDEGYEQDDSVTFLSSMGQPPASVPPAFLQVRLRGWNSDEQELETHWEIEYSPQCESTSVINEGDTIGYMTFTTVTLSSSFCPGTWSFGK